MGSLADLYSRRSTPWYDPMEAVNKLGAFIRECNNAKMKKITGATNRSMRVRMRSFA